MLILSSAKFIEAILPFIVFALIFGFKIIAAIAKKAQESDRSHRDTEEDMWQPQTTASPEPDPPASAQRSRQKASRQHRPLEVSAETHPDGISSEAAMAVMANERSDDRFEDAQDRAYDFERSDVPITSEVAFTVGRKRKGPKKKIGVNLKSRKQLRTAVVTREILARPRCFDI